MDNTNFGTWLFRVTGLDQAANVGSLHREELLPIIREGLGTYYTITDEALVDLHGLPEICGQLRGQKDRKNQELSWQDRNQGQTERGRIQALRADDLKAVPLIREGKKAYCTITKEALRTCKACGQVTAKVAELPRKKDHKKDQKFDLEEFVALLKNFAKLDADELDGYQRPILKQMRKKGELKWEIRLNPILMPRPYPPRTAGRKIRDSCPSR